MTVAFCLNLSAGDSNTFIIDCIQEIHEHDFFHIY
jgi:hypothetical protein